MTAGRVVDLDRESREALEFDALLERVAGHARTPMGAARIRALMPLTDARALGGELAAVSETRRHALAGGTLVTGRLPDPRAVIAALDVEGAHPDPRALRELAEVARAAAELRRTLLRLPAGEYPRLRELGGTVPDLGAEAAPVLAHVDPEGRLADDASPELRQIRAALRRTAERLRGMLERRLHGPDAEAVIRDDFVTERSGRFVIPVRTDSPRPMEGIIHAHSSSGATVFVEPLDTVPLNNERVRLADEELEERDRILAGWAARFAARREEALGAVEAVAAVDAWEARARFADDTGGVIPVVGEDEPLRLRQVRHPLLELRLRERGEACVPLDLEMDPWDQVLVLSGPNTGGKTVALKTLGLAALMAQSAIPVPAGDARLPLYRQVRADVGDHQSIQADLSTFSAHLLAVVRFLADLAPPAMVLFDEIGTGTEPTEGAALARAILEALLRPGVTTMATTHQGVLKAWAFATGGAQSAAMEFDTRTMRPTYRVLMGSAGVSAGLDIAERIGLAREIVQRARGHLEQGGARMEATLGRLRDLAAEMEREREALESSRSEWERRRARLEDEREREERRRGEEAARRLERALREIEQRAVRELAAIADTAAREQATRRWRRAEGKLRLEAARRRGELAGPVGGEPAPLSGEPRPGQRVHVKSLGRDGEVVRARGDRVEVRLGQLPFTVGRDDLYAPADAAPANGPRPRRTPRGAAAARPPEADDEAPREVMLIGKTVDEALPELDKSLDAAALSGLAELRVVHGHGTGRLRAAVRSFLSGHAHVRAHRPGKPYEGGDGATVVTLK